MPPTNRYLKPVASGPPIDAITRQAPPAAINTQDIHPSPGNTLWPQSSTVATSQKQGVAQYADQN